MPTLTTRPHARRARHAATLLAAALVLAGALTALPAVGPTRATADAAAPTLQLVTDRTEVEGAGYPATLTATATDAPTDEWVSLWDTTTGTKLNSCATTQTTCTAQVQPPTILSGTHTFAAYLTTDDPTAAPATPVAQSPTVDVARKAWALTLTTNKTTISAGDQAILTAHANQHLTYDNVEIRVLDDTDTSIHTSCSTWYWGADDHDCALPANFLTGPAHTYHAELRSLATGETLATSNPVTIDRNIWTVTLTQDRQLFDSGDYVHFTVATNQTIIDGGYKLYVRDLTTGLKYNATQASGYPCSNATTCYVTTTFRRGGPHRYQAFVSAADGTDIQATSNILTAQRTPWHATLIRTSTGDPATVQLSVQLNQLMYYPWNIHWYGPTGHVLSCTSPDQCVITVPADQTWYATVALEDESEVQAITTGYSADTGRSAPYVDENIAGGSPGAQHPQCSCADPVNTATGEFWLTHTDLTAPNRLGINLDRSYSTATANSTGSTALALGPGWHTLLDAHLRAPLDPTDPTTPVQVVTPNGAATYFTYDQPTAQYLAAKNVTDTLTRNADGTWTYTQPTTAHGTQALHFTAAGQLTTLTDADDTTVTLVRDASNLVTEITTQTSAGAPRPLYELTWANGHLATSATTDGTQVTYQHDSTGNLTSVTAATPNTGTNPPTTTYTYDDAHRILTTTSPRGAVVTNTYDTAGRVTTQTDALGATTTFTYTTAVGDPTATTRVTDPAGTTTDYTYDQGWLAAKTLGATSNTPAHWTWTNDATGRPAVTTDPAGNRTFVTYDPHGNPLQATDPAGTTTTWTWDTHNHPLTQQGPGPRTLTWTWSDTGHPTSLTTAAHNPPAADTQLGSHTWDWNSHGDLTAATDPLGHTTTWTYDTDGQPTSRTSAQHRTTTWTYTASGRPATATDATGTTAYTWSPTGEITSVTDPLGHTSHLAYDLDDHLVTVTDATGAVTELARDLDGRVTAQAAPGHRVTTWAYDPAGHPVATTSPAGVTTTRTFNAVGNLATQSVGNLATTTFTWDTRGNLTSASAPAPDGGAVTSSWDYDALNRIVRSNDPAGAQTTYRYDAAGHLTSVTDPLGHTTTRDYDPMGDLTSVTDPLGHTTSYGYDAAGLLTSVTDPLGHTTSYGYDADHLLASLDGPLPDDTTTRTYDAAGHLTAVTDPLDHATSYGYDAAGHLTSVTDPLGHTTRYTYDAAGRPTSSSAPGAGTTSYAYDAAGHLTSVTDPLDHTTSYTWDADGHPLTRTDAAGRTHSWSWDTDGQLSTTTAGTTATSYTHDTLGRTIGVDRPGTDNDATYTYDHAGRRTSLTDPTGQTSYTWDADGHLTATHEGTHTQTWTYDDDGHVSSATDATGTRTWTYDAAGRPTRQNTPAGATSYTWDTANRLATITQPGPVTTDRTWDATGHLTGTATTYADGRLDERTWNLDADGNPVHLSHTTQAGPTESPDQHQDTWAYDAAGRLAAQCQDTAATCTPLTADQTWTYDAAGHLLHDTTAGAGGTDRSWVYDPAGAVTSESVTHDGTTTHTPWTYDAAGQLLSDSHNTYTWDTAGNLGSVTPTDPAAASGTWSYAYDADGNRVSATRAADATHTAQQRSYTWDTQQALPQLTGATTTDASGTATYGYSWTPDGSADAMWSTTSSAAYALQSDRQGSVTAAATPDGVQAATQDYTPWGEATAAGTTALQLPADPNATVPGHAGQLSDPTGLTWLHARTYAPTQEQFLSPDPAAGGGDALAGQTWYGYANNSPLRYVDPTGLWGEGLRSFLGAASAQALDSLGSGIAAVGDAASTSAARVSDLTSRTGLQALLPAPSLGALADPTSYWPGFPLDLSSTANGLSSLAQAASDFVTASYRVGGYLAVGCFAEAGRDSTRAAVDLLVGGVGAASTLVSPGL